YVFPVPKGASVRKFSMWVDGKEVKGELVEADKARQIYTAIVQRTQDPGLLEYLGNNLIRLRVFPVPPRGDQKVALAYTAAADKDVGLTALAHRPVGDKGYFLLLVSPRSELSRSQQAPRDMVFVLDTSGSMRGQRIVQARNALKYCLKNLTAKDRFALINFA